MFRTIAVFIASQTANCSMEGRSPWSPAEKSRGRLPEPARKRRNGASSSSSWRTASPPAAGRETPTSAGRAAATMRSAAPRSRVDRAGDQLLGRSLLAVGHCQKILKNSRILGKFATKSRTVYWVEGARRGEIVPRCGTVSDRATTGGCPPPIRAGQLPTRRSGSVRGE